LTLNNENIEGSVVTVQPLRLRRKIHRYPPRDPNSGGAGGANAGANAGGSTANIPRIEITEANPKRVFVGNLRRKITKEVLEQTMQEYGMTKVEMSQNGNFAFVEFSTPEQADTVVNELNDAEVNGQPIRVKKEEPRTPRPIPPRRPRGPPSAKSEGGNAKPAGGEGGADGEGRGRGPRRFRRRAPNPTRVFMGGVPADCELTVIQEKFPGIKKGSVRNQVAFVFFETPEQAEAAITRNGEAIWGTDTVRIEKSRS
jgi:RNA recognition motif-containing protein